MVCALDIVLCLDRPLCTVVDDRRNRHSPENANTSTPSEDATIRLLF